MAYITASCLGKFAECCEDFENIWREITGIFSELNCWQESFSPGNEQLLFIIGYKKKLHDDMIKDKMTSLLLYEAVH